MSNEIQALIEAIELLEAATYRSQAMAVIADGKNYVTAAAAKLQKSRFSPSARLEFRSRVSGTIRRGAHLIADLAFQAGGGEQGKYPRDRVTEYINAQQRFLSDWYVQIHDEQRLVGGVNRAQMYADSLMGLYNEIWNSGKQESSGMPPLPAVPRDGTTQCLVNCRCHWEVQRGDDGEWLAYWRLSPVEHCDTCKCRAKHWSPLTLRAVGSNWVAEESRRPVTCDLYVS